LQGMLSLPGSFAENTDIIRMFSNATLQSDPVLLAECSPETTDPGLSLVSRACEQLGAVPWDTPAPRVSSRLRPAGGLGPTEAIPCLTSGFLCFHTDTLSSLSTWASITSCLENPSVVHQRMGQLLYL